MELKKIKTRVVGVDISPELTVFAIVNIRGNIIAEGSLPTSDYRNVHEYVSALCEKIVEIAEANGGYETIRSVGISVASGNYVTGCVENASNLSWKGNVPLAAMLRDQLGLAVGLANDAHATALGEKAYGSAHGMKNFIVISLGHGGLGSCVFVNDKAHLGIDGFAGEFGHTCMVENGRQCGCGQRGCLETYASDRGIIMTTKELLAEREEASLLRKLDKITCENVVECCEKGDRLAMEVMRRTGEVLGVGLANYASLLDPEAIILTGPLTKTGKWLLDPASDVFEAHVFHNIQGKVKLMVSILDDHERDVLGASALAWEVKEYSLFK